MDKKEAVTKDSKDKANVTVIENLLYNSHKSNFDKNIAVKNQNIPPVIKKSFMTQNPYKYGTEFDDEPKKY